MPTIAKVAIKILNK